MAPTARCANTLCTAVLAALLVTAWACDQSDFGDDGFDDGSADSPGVGDDEWGERNITCSASSECGAGEACIDGICQMERCQDGPYTSNAPLGESMTFSSKRELLAADGDAEQGAYWIDGYLPASGDLVHGDGASWQFGSRRVLDIAGGNLDGGRPEHFAAALEGSTEVHIRRDGHTERLNLGFQPIALATGDIDRNGVDEIIALGEDGVYGWCMATEGWCRNAGMSGDIRSIDVAAADIDGDGFSEVIFLVERGGRIELVIWNPHYEETGEPEFRTMAPDMGPSEYDFRRVAAGDLTGDGVAEVAAIHSRVYPADDRVKIYRFDGASLSRIGNKSLNSRSSVDLAIDDLDMSGVSELAVLLTGNRVDVYRDAAEAGSLASPDRGILSSTSDARRIATADFVGDSPRASRVADAELIPGPVVPLMAANFPPYDAANSSGVPNIFMGNTESSAETYTDTVSLGVGITVGFEADLFGVLGAGIKSSIQRQIQHAESTTTSQVIGNRYSILPQTDNYGYEYGVVLLSSGCFHRYTYELNDPAGYIASTADGERFISVVPVDGQVTLWTTHRYNALADRIDYLPTVEINTEIGNPESYPRAPERADGTPVPTEEMMFTDPPQYLVSDTGRTGWWLSHTETQAQSSTMTTTVGINSSLSAGASVSGDITAGIGRGYSVSVGEQYIFGGAVPAIEDDPSTPESEYELHAFSFAPFVYQETYEDPDGEEAGFFVLNFTVGD